MEQSLPTVRAPAREKVSTALSVFRTRRKSVSSKPRWVPAPSPPVAMADGADQLPSGNRATINPEPNLIEANAPRVKTEKTTNPYRPDVRYPFDLNMCE